MAQNAPGRLVVVSGPSGCGKTTVVRQVLQYKDLPLVKSISATTRPPRPTDRDGVTYRFMTPAAFAEARARGAFLECAQVHGNWYGTPRAEVERHLGEGKWVLLEIDVQGGLQIKRQFPDRCVLIFLEAPDPADYERRLRKRGEDSEDVIRRRLAGVQAELAAAAQYHYRVVNRQVEQAAEEIRRLLLDLAHGRNRTCSMN